MWQKVRCHQMQKLPHWYVEGAIGQNLAKLCQNLIGARPIVLR
ncbi:MAG: hypothetical protein OFPI_23780 [Osedax symbiont Rs2]|nr:MAG: hypothetical protein OFPI_23780 [Osedax symbiont Rs2]